MRSRKYFVLILILTFTIQAFACRFTVREIGFSTLSHVTYSLVLIGDEGERRNYSFVELQKKLSYSNINLLLLDPEKDNSHPAILAATKAKLKYPAILLLSPDGRILVFEESSLNDIIEDISSSPLTEIFIKNLHNTFAYVVLIESNDPGQNDFATGIVEKACLDITNRMPNMPKQVKNGPSVLSLSSNDFETERALLWSLGIDQIPDKPVAFVIYGRGRIIGDLIGIEEIRDKRVFQYLAMIGADCECGLDKKWMLGRQIPMNWSVETRQKITDELGFDVDNPMILAEMSHILSKDPVAGAVSDLTFAPKQLNLNDLYKSDESMEEISIEQKKRALSPLLIIIIISFIILSTGLIIFLLRIRRY